MMMKFWNSALRIALTALWIFTDTGGIDAFAPAGSAGPRVSISSSSLAATNSANTLVENLPDLDELKSAPFMKQVQYGSEMAEALAALEGTDEHSSIRETLRDSLSAQLSHSDGIRGFMVAYLTGSGEETITAETIASEKDPQVLLETVSGLLSDNNKTSEDLVSLMCMNVVMPIAMITMHQDPDLSNASRLTAARGIRLLGSVAQASGSITENLEAIQTAATIDTSSEDTLVDYWTNFFGKWGYEEAQKKDIAAAVEELLSKASQ